MNKNALVFLTLCAGMIGLYFKVEYSGWVLFFAILGFLA